jgi:hypothetical protein
MCKGQQILDHDSVYTKSIVEVDGTFGGCPGGERTCSKYGACNPTDATAKEWSCRPTTTAVGKASCADRYAKPHGSPPTKFDLWKFQSAKLMGGNWYSTQAGGSCDDPGAAECTWRVVDVVKTVNATCSNSNLHKAVVAHNQSCFAACGRDEHDTRSDCWTECFYTTVFNGGMQASDLSSSWLKAFESTEAGDGGCADLPPYVPPLPLVPPPVPPFAQRSFGAGSGSGSGSGAGSGTGTGTCSQHKCLSMSDCDPGCGSCAPDGSARACSPAPAPPAPTPPGTCSQHHCLSMADCDAGCAKCGPDGSTRVCVPK